MAAVNQRLAASLELLRRLQEGGTRVFSSEQLSRSARERLVRHGFLLDVMKGWFVSASPTALPGDTTPWFASFWEFCRRYCDARFGEAWHLSPEQSLLRYAENTVIPKQLIVYSPHANNNHVELLFGTSLFALKVKEMPTPRDVEVRSGLRVYGSAASLIRVGEGFFSRYPVEAAVVLGSIREPSDLLSRLLDGGHATIAGRLAGAFRHVGAPAVADEILATMRSADHDVREADPFELDQATLPPTRSAPPIVSRLKLLWATMRDGVLTSFPSAPRSKPDRDAYLRRIDDVYKLDAYHSLSIEGYQVTLDLVQRVATGDWNPDESASDRDTKNALAARGYWLAFQRVRETARKMFASETGPEIVRVAHREWYRELFAPHVAIGAIPASALAGYRNQPVYLRGSRHVPPRWELLGDAMTCLFDLIENEPEPAVRAVLGHWLFGYVHPFPDGNGRIARFVMNTLLAGGGYPWTVIRNEERDTYLHALERASVDGEIRPFASFVAGQMRWTSKTASRPSRTSRKRSAPKRQPPRRRPR